VNVNRNDAPKAKNIAVILKIKGGLKIASSSENKTMLLILILLILDFFNLSLHDFLSNLRDCSLAFVAAEYPARLGHHRAISDSCLARALYCDGWQNLRPVKAVRDIQLTVQKVTTVPK